MTSKCGGHNRAGKPCENTAGYKTDHVGFGNCAFHGGATPNGTVNAHREEAQHVLSQLVPDLAEPVTDPLGELSKIAGEVVAFKDAIRQRVNRLQEVRFEDAKGAEQLRSEVVLLERAFDRCEKFLSSMAKLDFEGRQTRMMESQADEVVSFARALVSGLGLEWGDPRVAGVVAGAMRQLEAGAA